MHLKRLLGVFARVGSRGLRQSRRLTKRCQASALQTRAPQMSNLQRAASAALESRWGLRSHPSLCDGVWDWVAETGLERPAYHQMPLRGNKTGQTPIPGMIHWPI